MYVWATVRMYVYLCTPVMTRSWHVGARVTLYKVWETVSRSQCVDVFGP